MPLYEFRKDSLIVIPITTYSSLKLRERDGIQRVVRDYIEVILPDVMVLAEEFGDWEDSKRRIDLLGLDRERRLVVFELKRTEDGGHMELQALRYAAMVSTMRFEQAINAHEKYLEFRGQQSDVAEARIREFLGIMDGPVTFSGKVRIALVSADFSIEITSAVLWLNTQGLDITCITARPHSFKESVLMDVQQVIPLPEAAEYQVAIREKSIEVAAAEASRRDYTRFNLKTPTGEEHQNLPKRWLMFHIVQEAIRLGVSPEAIGSAVSWRSTNMFLVGDGNLTGEQLFTLFPAKSADRFFSKDDEVFKIAGRTYALTNQWGERTDEAVSYIVKLLPAGHGLVYEAAD